MFDSRTEKDKEQGTAIRLSVTHADRSAGLRITGIALYAAAT